MFRITKKSQEPLTRCCFCDKELKDGSMTTTLSIHGNPHTHCLFCKPEDFITLPKAVKAFNK